MAYTDTDYRAYDMEAVGMKVMAGAEEALDAAVERAREASDELRDRAEKLQKRGRKTLDEQKEKVADLVGNNKHSRFRR